MNAFRSVTQRLSLKHKVVIIFGLLATLPLLAIGWLSVVSTSDVLEQQVTNNLVDLITTKEQALDEHYEMLFHNAASLAQSSALHAMLQAHQDASRDAERTQRLHEATEEVLRNYQEEHWGVLHHVFLANKEGTVLVSPGHDGKAESHVGEHMASSPFFAPALEQPQVTDFFGFEEADHYHQLLFQPVRTTEGHTLGMVIFEISIPDVRAKLQLRGIADENNTSRVFMATLEGREIIGEKAAAAQWHKGGFLEASQHGKSQGTYVSDDGVEVFGYYARSPKHPWVLGIEVEREEAYAVVREQAQEIALLVLVSVAIVAFLSYLIGSLMTRRLQQMAQTARAIASGDFEQRMVVHAEDEVGELSKTFNQMVSTIRDALERAKERGQAAEQAAHEVKLSHLDTQKQKQYLSQCVEYMLNRMEAFADGDLTVRLEEELDAEYSDEAIVKLFIGFNRAVANLQNMIARVEGTIAQTAAASNQISQSTDHLFQSAQEQSQQSIDVAAAVEETVRTIVENAHNATLTADVAVRNGDAASAGGEVVAETVEKIRQLAEIVTASTHSVERLGERSEQVGEIVGVIQDIADQTKLLALNAAIEAARAGEQGRGFAVVAEEVSKLAERTTEATKEIATMIHGIQAETGEAVVAMRRGKAEVEAGITLADEAGTALGRIVDGAGETVELINQIAAASEEQSTTSEEIARSVDLISRLSRESTEELGQIADTTTQLNGLTQELHNLITRFKTEGRQAQVHTHVVPASRKQGRMRALEQVAI